MPIGTAVQRGSVVFVYDENGRQTATLSAGSRPGDGLQGYTSARVNVRRGSVVFSFDERGRQVGTTSAR